MMKTLKSRTNLFVMLLLFFIPSVIFAQGSLNGAWKYVYAAGEMKMQITDKTITIDGASYTYKTESNSLMVYEEGTYTAYPYSLNGNQLTLGFPDGSKIAFTRDSGNSEVIDKLPQSPQKIATGQSTGARTPALTGKWLFQRPEGELALEFLPGNQLIFNGETTQYQLQEGIIQAKGDYGWINYPYTFSQGKLLITFPDGTQLPFIKASVPSNQSSIDNQSPGGSLTWQLQGSLCYWSGSSDSNSSYSRTERLDFDGKGNFSYSKESGFSSNAGIAYSGDPNAEKGTYRIEEKYVFLNFQSGGSYKVEINMRQDNGRITELMYQGKLYAVALCKN